MDEHEAQSFYGGADHRDPVGAGAITLALHGIARSLGVEIRTSADVNSIRVERGSAIGVALIGSETIDADCVVASVAPKLLFGGLNATPPEVETDDPNLVGGDCVSGSHHLDQNLTRHLLRGWSRSPIRGLYMTGAATWPGDGVHGRSGYLLANGYSGRSETDEIEMRWPHHTNLGA